MAGRTKRPYGGGVVCVFLGIVLTVPYCCRLRLEELAAEGVGTKAVYFAEHTGWVGRPAALLGRVLSSGVHVTPAGYCVICVCVWPFSFHSCSGCFWDGSS